MRISVGLPLASNKNCERYEQEYYSSQAVGRHLYEGNPIEGMEFDDWRKLPSLTPRSLMKMDVPEPLKKMVEEAETVYDKAVQFHLLNERNELLCPKEEWLTLIDSLLVIADSVVKIEKDDDSLLGLIVQKLETYANSIPLEKTSLWMPNDGFSEKEEVRKTVQKDYFLSSPVIQIEAAKSIDRLEKLNEAANRSIKELNKKIGEISSLE